ncbi:uncharacterized protein HaLaN_23121 [Haematococcus lacustris]|uniref:Uncharacterized protein n=1 Tax=Haematococcus lacustris TaxID=44745 RepID=A0A699ZTD3_HAELA|nr:uncharacterized protein HaLaN_23121 [Haematococcus lacustris]
MAKKHSTFFASMMRELKLDDTPEVYLDEVPWQIVGPSVYRTYLAAAQRLNLSEEAAGYW